MAGKLEIYNDVVTRLMSETVACTPLNWTKGELTIECDGVRINYRLKNSDEAGTAAISDRLRDLIDELYVRMSQAGDAWTEAVFTFWREGDDLKFKSQFQYPGASPTVERKPWWRLWR